VLTDHKIEVSVVIPCLNEADTVASCVAKAWEGLRAANAVGEVIVADNGSTDGSPTLAVAAGARVVHVDQRGYGAALMAGIDSAKGRYVIMGDADDSYDFREIPRFVEPLRAGAHLVQGCRLPSGGGRIDHGAMPFLHRWIGNPFFSFLVRWWFKAPIHDVNCGLRGFLRSYQQELEQQCTGMEFANEMVIKMSLSGARIVEVPITLKADGRLSHASHLRTWRDGWCTLRFYLLCSPRWLFLVPGLALVSCGIAFVFAGYLNLRLGPATFDINTMLFGVLFISIGIQTTQFAVFSKTFAVNERLLPTDPRLTQALTSQFLDRVMLFGVLALLSGAMILLWEVIQWGRDDFGTLPTARVVRRVVPGVLLALIGTQAVISTFFLSVLGMQRRVAGSARIIATEGLRRVTS
jgi:glycosyltransferase involved in cell wall biosynthesis